MFSLFPLTRHTKTTRTTSFTSKKVKKVEKNPIPSHTSLFMNDNSPDPENPVRSHKVKSELNYS